MRLSEKYDVAPEVALLYDFVNTLDQRRYVEDGAALTGGDEIEDPHRLEGWMRERGLLHRGEKIDVRSHRAALELRSALRDFLLHPPEERAGAKEEARQLTAISGKFPLTLAVSAAGAVELVHSPDSTALAGVLGQMIRLAQTGQLGRLKTCASEDCRWIFLDRSKPANRHWCSSLRCGNRHKTRAYRLRQRQGS